MAAIFLTSVLDGVEWSATRPCRITPGERANTFKPSFSLLLGCILNSTDL
jgi:hypothetical protein